ncbi:MAG: lytic transglycosylase domain-containing protein [Thermodesulfobacteriota bacterium]|nr:lytic transglycosylase domain-containing protein [Thermodesulfobacteriota bacterium]
MEEVVTVNIAILKMFRSLSIALFIIVAYTLLPSESNKSNAHLNEKQRGFTRNTLPTCWMNGKSTLVKNMQLPLIREACQADSLILELCHCRVPLSETEGHPAVYSHGVPQRGHASGIIKKHSSTRSHPSSIFLHVKKAEQSFHTIIMQASIRHNVDPALVKAVILAESSFNPNAISYKGAEGLMQLMPKTARGLGVHDSFNPEHNIKGGVKYLKRLLDRFNGDIKLALAAYNAGTGKVLKYNGVPPYNQTKKYIKRVFFYYEYYKAEMAKAKETTNA